MTARVPLVAAAAVTLLVASLASPSTAAAAPADGAPPLAPAVTVPAHQLRTPAGTGAAPRALGGTAAAGESESGRSSASGVPASGRYTFLLKLKAPSTLTAYNGASPRGKAAAASAARSQFAQVKASQAQVVGALPKASSVVYRTHSALAAVAVTTDVKNLPALKKIAGVQAVYPIAPKTPSNSYAVPLQGAPAVWGAYGDLGQNATIAVIDTGIDYTHANFGGPGTVAAYQKALATDAEVADPALFPSTKIIDGYDFAGDDYVGSNTPAPDPNPLDCGDGHGSHVAGTAAGLGVTSAGTTFHGPYNASTNFAALRIGPGMAPGAKILAYRVFGCEGSSGVVGEAIDRAADPNGDGDPSDHASVINMSLGSDFGSPQDGDSMLSNAVSELGISVVVAAGNGGDYYDVGGSPADAVRTIAVANSVDASNVVDGVKVTAPASIAKVYGAERSIAFDYKSGDLAGTVAPALSAANADGCDPLSAADAALVKGKIAFLEWTETDTARRCGSVARSGNVQVAGAIGFIFADDSETFGAGITGSALIPGVLVVKTAADAIRAHLAEGVKIGGTVPNAVRQVFPQDNDKVNEGSSRGIRGAGNVKPDVTAVGTSVFSTSVGTGTEGISYSGTSMATPMVAGLSALVRSVHPDWTAEETKADIMNTAGQDLYTGDNHTGDKYAPNRVGSGRIQAVPALGNTVLAMVKDDPGAVSASFGPVAVTGPTTLTKTIKVVNKSLTPVTYKLAYQALTSVPGVSYKLSASSISVDRLSTRTFTVSMVVSNASKLTKTVDPTVALTQSGLPREFLADASGRIVLTPATGSKPKLRVPVYSAPRPASVMTQGASVTMPSGVVQKTILPLTGKSVRQGSGATSIQSTVAGFELQAVSGPAPTCTSAVTTQCVSFSDERSADLKYVGSTSNAPQINTIGGDVRKTGLLYFSITTQGPWRTAVSQQEFDVLIDTDGDGQADVVLYNTRYLDQDIMVSQLVDLNTGAVLDIQPIDDRFGDVDAALFDSDTMVLPVAIKALPRLPFDTRIRYGIQSYSLYTGNSVDAIGVDASGNLSRPLSINPFHPGLAVYGSFDGTSNGLLYADAPGTLLQIRRDRLRYQLDGGLGLLMVHLHNKVGNKAQIVTVNSTPPVAAKPSS